MMRQLSLSAVASCTLNSDGNGVAVIGPATTRETWTPGTASVSASSNTNEATAKIYAGNEMSMPYFVDGTTWGSTGDSTSNFSGSVYPGQQIWCSWTGGDPYATATMVITGTRTVP
jgi:hypothetical protein